MARAQSAAARAPPLSSRRGRAVRTHATGPLSAVRVELGPRSYEVVVGPGARSVLPGMMPSSARQAVVVTQPGIDVAQGLDTGLPTTIVEMAPGEQAKSLETVEVLCRRFADVGLARADVVVAVGGGVVTDVGGFAAACWHRGTPVVHVPTTLLGQVDAAIGGKTGVNLPEGKNLVGAFWQPSGVVCDTDVLAGLPAAEWRSGRGELAKYAFLGVEDLDDLDLPAQVARCVECKARIISADETDAAGRMALNYGHTLAHALEAAGLAGDGDALRHGEAVAIGLVFAARLARSLGRIDEDRLARHETLLAAYDLPRRLPAGVEPRRLLELMYHDKKAHGSLTFVLDGPRGVEPVRGVPDSLVLEVLEGLR
jgi:5-deoxy-5-amino-3-dehydroquinate synthase